MDTTVKISAAVMRAAARPRSLAAAEAAHLADLSALSQHQGWNDATWITALAITRPGDVDALATAADPQAALSTLAALHEPDDDAVWKVAP